MKWLTSTLIVLSLASSLSACSTQWRTTDAGVDGPTVFAIIDEILPGATASGAGGKASEFYNLAKHDETAFVFFAEGPGPMGSAESIVAFNDFTFMGAPDVYREDIKSATVVFIEGHPMDAPNRYGLLIHIQLKEGERQFTRIFMSNEAPHVEDKEIFITLSDGATSINLRTTDVVDGVLANVIQLELGQFDEFDQNIPFGKVSTLQGFAP